MTIHIRMIMFAILAILKLCLGPAMAQVGTDLSAQAKKKGRVTWYTTVSIPESKQFMDMFEKQYPFIKVDLLRSGSGPLVNRVVSEYAAKNYAADVLHGMSTEVASPSSSREIFSAATNRPSTNTFPPSSGTRMAIGGLRFRIPSFWLTTNET